ncbi:unnamed protein product [Brassica rapa subsp. trilocularis]
MFLPRNVGLAQLEELAWLSSPPLNLEVRHLSKEYHNESTITCKTLNLAILHVLLKKTVLEAN